MHSSCAELVSVATPLPRFVLMPNEWCNTPGRGALILAVLRNSLEM